MEAKSAIDPQGTTARRTEPARLGVRRGGRRPARSAPARRAARAAAARRGQATRLSIESSTSAASGRSE